MGAPDQAKHSVCAVVVTRNRKELLRRCLRAIDDQAPPVDHVVVVDNASDDDTPSMVQAEFAHVTLLELHENLGGAGGFGRGMAWAHQHGYDWLWLMDDDTVAEQDALRALLAGAARAPGGTPLLVASSVLWKDGRQHPMNLGLPRWRWRSELVRGASHGLLLMRYATFVSIAVRREAIDRFGLPLAHYFVRADDVEYTARVLKRELGFLVPESRVYHWTEKPHGPDSGGGDRFYYLVRNSLLLLRGSSLDPAERLDYGRWLARAIGRYLRANGTDRHGLGLLARGLRDGLRGEAR
jgi:rhamnopyranosyl-N-acetylglucosaminyl-diphospho-decaprenol beta-1,3/1,4-galactofuranosyltransferase